MNQAKIANGTFTLTWPDGERHRTFKIKTQPHDSTFFPGKRVISLMTGSDNESSYTGFGMVDDNGIAIWQSVRKGTSKIAYKVWNDGKLPIWVRVLWELATKGEASRFYSTGMRLQVAERCIVCNRKLTTPESIRSKIGPECVKRTGFGRGAPRMPQRYGGKYLPRIEE